MKTRYRFIWFAKHEDIWFCMERKSNKFLCIITYHEEWKEFVLFDLLHGGVLGAGCLRDIASFLDQLNEP